MQLKRIGIPATLSALFFLCAGLAVLPYPGLQNDEAIFVPPLYSPVITAAYQIGQVPVMLMDYAGCLKAWLYAPIFAVFPPSLWSIRLPVLLVGTLSVALFTILLSRIAGTRAAFIGGTLLATDPVFALTNNFDWGPVALQHFLLLAGLFAIHLFHKTAASLWLAIAGFSFGLALWDKALFLWLLVPLFAVSLLLWRRQLTAVLLNPRQLTAASLGFLIGAAPLLIFNFTHQWITFHSHAVFTLADLSAKLMTLHYTANGSVMFGYMVEGKKRTDLLEWGFALALCLLPFVWRSPARRPALFSLFVLGAAWAQMVVTSAAGGAAHHAILLWPFPQLLIAVVLAQYRRIGPVVAVTLVLANLLVCYQYWSNLRQVGTSLVWTDAITPLSADRNLAQADLVCIADWGVISQLITLHKGLLPIEAELETLSVDKPTPDQLDSLRRHLHHPKAVWVSHPDGKEFFSGVNRRLLRIAHAESLKKVSLHIYPDTHGHPALELFRFAPLDFKNSIAKPSE